MIALALDTSGPVGSVAVLGDDEGAANGNSGGVGNGLRVLARRTIGHGMRHGVELFPAIEAALAEAGRAAREIDVVAVGTGPGSYTGLRVGVTAARALAYAAGAELIGVPSCDALAESTPIWAEARCDSECDSERDSERTSQSAASSSAPTSDAGAAILAVVVDARVRAVYVALYRAVEGVWTRDADPEILPPAEAASRIPAGAFVIGDGPDAHADAFAAFRRVDESNDVGAPSVARLALALRARGERQKIDAVIPLYLRKTEAERKLARGEL